VLYGVTFIFVVSDGDLWGQFVLRVVNRCSLLLDSSMWCQTVFCGVKLCFVVFYGVKQCNMVLIGVL